MTNQSEQKQAAFEAWLATAQAVNQMTPYERLWAWRAFQAGRASMQSTPAAEQEPFMYGIQDPDGKAHYSEFCVAPDAADLFDELDGIDGDSNDGYKIVALYTAPQSNAALERDAERYRWLRADIGGREVEAAELMELSSEKLDAAIDAAIDLEKNKL